MDLVLRRPRCEPLCHFPLFGFSSFCLPIENQLKFSINLLGRAFTPGKLWLPAQVALWMPCPFFCIPLDNCCIDIMALFFPPSVSIDTDLQGKKKKLKDFHCYSFGSPPPPPGWNSGVLSLWTSFAPPLWESLLRRVKGGENRWLLIG